MTLPFNSFEKTLKQKLAQKASGNANEEAVLMKAFKYFDLNNNGTVEPDEFAKAVEKIGIMIPTRQVSSFHSLGPPFSQSGLSFPEILGFLTWLMDLSSEIKRLFFHMVP